MPRGFGLVTPNKPFHPGNSLLRPADSGVLTFCFHQAARELPCNHVMRTGFLRQQLLFWGLILGLWFLLVLVFAGQLILTNNVEWRDALTLSLRDWFPWALLAPVVAWMAFKFPIERGHWALSVPVHVAACTLAVIICDFLARPATVPFGPPPGIGGTRLGEQGPNAPGRPGFRRPLEDRQFAPPAEGGPDGGGVIRPDNAPPANRQPGIRQPDLPRENRPAFGIQGPGPENLRPGPEGRFMPGPRGEIRRRMYMEGLVMRAKFNLPIYWIIVSIVHALTWYRRSQERERSALQLEARLADARLDALRMQLHPHFLFNTLNAISTLVHRDANAADEMIGNLSELLRATLDTTEQEITLRQELHFLDRYLEIQQVRFGDRLQVEKEIDAAALDVQVPTLILQPLVENAIRHGIEPQTGQGRLHISASRDEEMLHLRVRDNGSGNKPASEAKDGIGIANTRSRLQQLYGGAAHLILTTAADGGFIAAIDLPCRETFDPKPAAPSIHGDKSNCCGALGENALPGRSGPLRERTLPARSDLGEGKGIGDVTSSNSHEDSNPDRG